MKLLCICLTILIGTNAFKIPALNKKMFNVRWLNPTESEIDPEKALPVEPPTSLQNADKMGFKTDYQVSDFIPRYINGTLVTSRNGFLDGLNWMYNQTVKGLNKTMDAASGVANVMSPMDWYVSMKAKHYEGMLFNDTGKDGDGNSISRQEVFQQKLQSMYSTMIECVHPCGKGEVMRIQCLSIKASIT
jgi:hypothetical protein